MPEDLKLSQIGSSQLPPPFRGLHSPGVRKHCQIIFACYFRKSSIERAHRAGKAIIIKLLSYKDKEKILKGAKNLASTNKDIWVREDFSQAVQTKGNKLVPMMKTLRKDGKRGRLRFDKLVTDDGTFTFNLQTFNLQTFNLIEKLNGDRRSRSKTTADWNGSGNTKRYNEAGDSDSNVWGN